MKFGLGQLIQTKAEFSYAIAVIDRIGGWIEGGGIEDGSQIGGRLAVCIWILSKAVVCNGQNYMKACRNQQNLLWKPLIVSVHVCRINHDWIAEFSLVLQEHKVLGALNHDTEVSCMVHWELLWYSAPSSLNNLLNDDVIFEM